MSRERNARFLETLRGLFPAGTPNDAIAARLKLSQSFLSDWGTGKRGVTLWQIAKIHRVFGMTAALAVCKAALEDLARAGPTASRERSAAPDPGRAGTPGLPARGRKPA